MKLLLPNEVFGFIKTSIDAHTLGISTISQLLRDCGYKALLSPEDVSEAVLEVKKINNLGIIRKWIADNGITRIGFSYRLDPQEASFYFCDLFYHLQNISLFEKDGGPIRDIFFAGLPDACELVKKELGQEFLVFPGDETPIESLSKLGVWASKFPKTLVQDSSYDKMRWEFSRKLIASEKHKLIRPQNHYGYQECGNGQDSYLKRLEYCKRCHSLPIIRVHVGPYNSNRLEAIKEFISWEKDLGRSKLLDVLSIGSSQLTQSNFGEEWNEAPNGGGVPVNSELEYLQIAEAAKPMLVRTYAGTKNIPWLAAMHERTLNISWHALSFWWFCEIDGRGKNTVLQNLKEHIETLKYIAQTGKPLEPNVPHHFAFRGADDLTYIISGYLVSKTAKKYGIRHLILQNMLNTPKHTWGVQDLAKGRTMLKLIKELEDSTFKVSLQSRAGLDYFSPDIEKAKIQLAAVTALMDDIEPENPNSPAVIHVVSYSEAVRLATPPVIKESIQITLASLKEYRKQRKLGLIENMAHSQDVKEREYEMYEEAKSSIAILEKQIPNIYTPEGLFKVFYDGFFPVPYMLDSEKKYINATNYNTAFKNGGIRVIDEAGNVIRTDKRYTKILSKKGC